MMKRLTNVNPQIRSKHNYFKRMATPEQKILSEMAYLNKQLEGLTEDNPADLQKIILIKTKLLQPLGKMLGLATKEYKQDYAERKHGYGTLIVQTNGTGVEKEGQAEIGIKNARDIEAEKEGEMIRWRHAFISTQELIQAQKLILRAMITELENANIGGGA